MTPPPPPPLLLRRLKIAEDEQGAAGSGAQLAQQVAEVQRALASLQGQVEGSAQQAVGTQAVRRDISLLVDAVQVGAGQLARLAACRERRQSLAQIVLQA